MILSSVTGFDLERRVVHTTSLPGRFDEYPYDSLIVAAGAGQSYFGHDEFALIAPGMKTIDDAMELRRRVYGALELAETMTDEALERFWMTFVIVGAGPTGVELAGQIRELAARSLGRDFRTIDPSSVRVILVDGGTEPLATFGGELSERARRSLEKMGVELQMGLRVVGVDPFGVDTENEPKGRRRFECGDHDLGRRRPGVATGRHAGRGHGRRRPTGPGASRSCPTSACRATPRSSRWATWRRSTNCPASPRWPCRAACTRRNTIKRRLKGKDERPVQVPRPRDRRRHRPLQVDRQRPRASA